MTAVIVADERDANAFPGPDGRTAKLLPQPTPLPHGRDSRLMNPAITYLETADANT